MKKIKIQKLDKTELEVLQKEIMECAVYLGGYCHKLKYDAIYLEEFLDSILALDISNQLFYILRSKIENQSILTTLNLPVSQAVVIMKVCQSKHRLWTSYESNLMLKISRTIDQQLKSLI